MRGLDFARRLSAGVVDQVVSSGSNFAATLLAARYLDRTGFGAFSLAVVLYTLSLGICRSLCSEALLLRPGSGDDARHESGTSALGAAVWIGSLALLLLLVASSLVDGHLQACLLILALVLPGLLLQDVLRYLSFAREVPSHALRSDLAWTIGMAAGFSVLIVTDGVTAERLLATWGVAGGAAGIGHLVAIRTRPAVHRRLEWVRRHRDLSVPYTLDFLSGQGAANLSSLVLALVAGVAATGSVRGAITLFGPVNIMFTGAYVILVPEGRRAIGRSTLRLTQICLGASSVLAAAAAAITIALSIMPDRWGEALLGQTWQSSRDIIPLIGIAAIGSGAMAGALTGLRSLGQAGTVLRTRLVTMPTTIGLPLLGVLLADAKGMAVGLIAAIWIGVFAYWRAYILTARDHDQTTSSETTTTTVAASHRAAGGGAG